MTELLIIPLAILISSISWFFIHRFSIMAQLENQMEVLLFNEEIQSDYCYSVIDSFSAFVPRKCESCSKVHSIFDYISIFNFNESCSKRNPLVLLSSELFIILLTYIFYTKYGFTYPFIIFCILILFFFVITIIDFKYYIIPDELNYSGLILGLLLHSCLTIANHYQWIPKNSIIALSRDQFGFIYSISGVVLGAGILFCIAHIVSVIVNKEAMGGGDIKLIAFIGAFLGYKTALMSLAISSLLGSIFGLISLVKSKLIKKNQGYTTIAFGPYIIFATLIVMYFGESYLIDLYIDFSRYWVSEYTQTGY
ncbi:MAG: prepilin peptidase [Candidatus Cloacimonetes bacterium]|nr:prepilin peptidase [Candidatus Cloacimonadota bacterium]